MNEAEKQKLIGMTEELIQNTTHKTFLLTKAIDAITEKRRLLKLAKKSQEKMLASAKGDDGAGVRTHFEEAAEYNRKADLIVL